MMTGPARKSSGFSMVEALVALVVLGVGMLGIASLYVVTLRSSGSAISRMQAVNLASDLGDRIRANRTAATAYVLNGITADEEDEEDESAGCMGADRNCSPAQMAAHDLHLWQQQVLAALPSAQATVAVDTSTNPNTYTITVSWLEAQENDAEGADPEDNRLSYVLRMQI